MHLKHHAYLRKGVKELSKYMSPSGLIQDYFWLYMPENCWVLNTIEYKFAILRKGKEKAETL